MVVGWFMKNHGFEELNKNAQLKIGSWVKPWVKWVVPFFVSLLVLCSFFLVTWFADYSSVRKLREIEHRLEHANTFQTP